MSIQFLVLTWTLLSSHAAWSFTVAGSAPLSGPPGTLVTVTGMDFEASPGYTVIIDGSAVPASDITGTSLTFTIPPGATSGKVEITDGSTTITLAKPFKVTRVVPGLLALPSGLSANGWQASGGDAFVEVDGAGNFTVEVGVDEPTMVWVFRNSDEVSFMTLVVPADNVANVNATTTAAALVYLVPLVGSQPTTAASNAKWADVLTHRNLLFRTVGAWPNGGGCSR